MASVEVGPGRRSNGWRAVGWLALAAVCLGGLCAWSYGDCTHAFFCFDDYWELAVAGGIHIRSPLDLAQFLYPDLGFQLYRPLSTRLYFYLLHAAFGYDPAWYHRVQILFHVFNGLLVYLIAAALFSSRPVGLVGALIYATAPGHAIAACHNALFTETGAAFWYFLALWVWLRLRGRWRVPATMALFGAALLSSEHAVTFPIVLAMRTVLLERPWDWRATLRQQGGFYLVAAAYVAAKLYYLYWLLPAAVSPLGLAFIRSGYGVALRPSALLDNLGRYFIFALDVAYQTLDPERWAYAAGGMVAGVAVLSTVAVVTGRWTARALQLGVFGVDVFVVALGPVLVLTGRLSSHYVGIAGLGIALAIVGFTRALPRFPTAAASGAVMIVLLVYVLFTAARVRESGEFRFFSMFSGVATRWLYTLSLMTAPATVRETIHDVYVPKDLVTDMVFEVGHAHKLFLCARYEVHTSADVDAIQPLGGRVILHDPLPLPASYAANWAWLRAACSDGR